MGKTTGISWTDHTFNLAIGCHKVSDGCKFCYAERDSARFDLGQWGPPATTHRRMLSESYWRQPLSWNKAAEQAGERRRVFCASMADWLEDHPDLVEPRLRLADLIDQTPWLDWLLLTKRIENFERLAPDRWLPWGSSFTGKLPRNVWLGISTEDQNNFDSRWPVFENVVNLVRPAVTFLSVEPLLGPLDLRMALEAVNTGDEDHDAWTRPVDWVIVGGESGPHLKEFKNADRICRAEWVHDIMRQIGRYDGIAFFFKQWGGWQKVEGVWGGDKIDGQQYHEFPNVTRA